MQINSAVNVEYLNLFEPSMLDEEEERQVIPTVEDLAPHGPEEFKEKMVLQHKEWTTRRGQQEIWKIDIKGETTRKVMRYERNQIASKFPHLSLAAFRDQNPPNREV
jgi:hypothetical protein